MMGRDSPTMWESWPAWDCNPRTGSRISRMSERTDRTTPSHGLFNYINPQTMIVAGLMLAVFFVARIGSGGNAGADFSENHPFEILVLEGQIFDATIIRYNRDTGEAWSAKNGEKWTAFKDEGKLPRSARS